MNYEERDPYGMYKADPAGALDGARPRGPGPELMGAATLTGDKVVNRDDETLGEIKEIMLDMRSGRVAYAVMSYGGVFGIGDKLFAVPWNALKLDTVKKCFVLDAAKSKVEDAPGFDQDAWPNMADATWQKRVHDYYGTQPYTHESAV